MSGTVITFYSYKGGVGRSFTLANVAILLARWGYRVLAIDWDLEAPGLYQYFAPLIRGAPAAGVVDLVEEFRRGHTGPVAPTRLHLDEPGVVDLLPAGRRDSAYVGRIQDVDWADLYDRGFADVLERHRENWTDDHDFVLIDSRTGISDIGGICTAHLPDRLVMVFTPNMQNIEGVLDIAGRANLARDRMPYDRPQLTVLPLLSRMDSRDEYQRAEQWHQTCATLTAPLFRNWLDRNVPVELMLRHATLPYVSYWSFGEQLPVLEEQTPSAIQISFALETIAAIIAHEFDRTDLLADNRDAYVAAARAPGREFELDVLVSSPRSAVPVATDLIDELRALGLKADRSLSGDVDFLDRPRDPARHLCLVVDGEVTRWQRTEAERFLRHTLGDGEDRRLFSVLTEATEPARLPPFLRNLRHLTFGVGDVARTLLGYLSGNGSAYRDAASALRELPTSVPYSYGWDVVEQILVAMSEALSADDAALLRDLTTDLELAARIRASHHSAERFATPGAIRTRIDDLLTRLDRREDARP